MTGGTTRKPSLAPERGSGQTTVSVLSDADLAAIVSALQARGFGPVASPGQSVFTREGDYWTVAHGGRTARLRHSKGLNHLAHLLGHPGREFHALDLVALDLGEAPNGQRHSEPAEEVLDQSARCAYRRRLSELSEELEEAQSFHDGERAARAKAEIDHLVEHLALATGLGGRSRRTITNGERARVSVSKALKAAVDRIQAANPDLGRHLAKTIRTGTFCVYQAESPLSLVM